MCLMMHIQQCTKTVKVSTLRTSGLPEVNGQVVNKLLLMMNQCSVNDIVDKSNPAYFLSCIWAHFNIHYQQFRLTLHGQAHVPQKQIRTVHGMWPNGHLSVRRGSLVPREFACVQCYSNFWCEKLVLHWFNATILNLVTFPPCKQDREDYVLELIDIFKF